MTIYILKEEKRYGGGKELTNKAIFIFIENKSLSPKSRKNKYKCIYATPHSSYLPNEFYHGQHPDLIITNAHGQRISIISEVEAVAMIIGGDRK